MNFSNSKFKKLTISIIGFGAFGQLIARHLPAHSNVCVYDINSDALPSNVTRASLENAAKCEVVVLATPVSCCEEIVTSIAPHCRPGALVIDVGSVKVLPAEIMERVLPKHVDIVATHPLFGPQSARDGIKGLKIAVCPIRGKRHLSLIAFLDQLGLEVIIASPQDHDREVATVQGLTHLIAKVLLDMGPMPTRMTTLSFDLLMEAISMVQDDAPEVFEAIEKSNPYALDVRRRFFELAQELDMQLQKGEPALDAHVLLG